MDNASSCAYVLLLVYTEKRRRNDLIEVAHELQRSRRLGRRELHLVDQFHRYIHLKNRLSHEDD